MASTRTARNVAQLGKEALGFPDAGTDDEVANCTTTTSPRLRRSPSLNPEVEDIVQIEIGEQRTHAAALHGPPPPVLPVLQHAGPSHF